MDESDVEAFGGLQTLEQCSSETSDYGDVLRFYCSICCAQLSSRTRGVFKISRSEGTKPVSDRAWSELFDGCLDGEAGADAVVCRQCHRLLEEYGNIEADLNDCRQRIVDRFRSSRAPEKVSASD